MRYGSPDSGVLQIIWSFRESSREETEGHARLEGKTMFFNYNFYTLASRLSTCKVYGILFWLLAFILKKIVWILASIQILANVEEN